MRSELADAYRAAARDAAAVDRTRYRRVGNELRDERDLPDEGEE